MRRLRERQQLSLAVPTTDPDFEVADLDCLVLLTEADTALLQTTSPRGFDLPLAPGVALIGFEHEGSQVMLRGVAEQLAPTLFAFRVSDGVSLRQLRGSSRMDVAVPVVASASGMTDIHGATVDLSRTGALLDLPQPPLEGNLLLTLDLPGAAEPLRLTAQQVRHGERGLAVRFVDSDPDMLRRLESFILTAKVRALWAVAA
jgi:hypothetical protein